MAQSTLTLLTLKAIQSSTWNYTNIHIKRNDYNAMIPVFQIYSIIDVMVILLN